MRVWLQKQKKKEETKAAEANIASEATATPAVEPTPANSELQASVGSADKLVESIEEASRTARAATDPSPAEQVVEDGLRPTSAAPHREEVSTKLPRSGISESSDFPELTLHRDPRLVWTRHSKKVSKIKKTEKTGTRGTLDKTRTTHNLQTDPMARQSRIAA
jgi:hypothetical protein